MGGEEGPNENIEDLMNESPDQELQKMGEGAEDENNLNEGDDTDIMKEILGEDLNQMQVEGNDATDTDLMKDPF